MLQVPDSFLRAVVDFELPAEGSYATGIAFLPQSARDAATACEAVAKIVEAEGLDVLGWRECRPTTRRWRAVARRDADLPPAVHRRRLGPGARAAGLCDPQTRRARAGLQGPGQDGLTAKPSTSQAFRSHVHLQGHADHPAAQGVLPGSAGRAARAPWASCTPVLHQHLPRRGRWPSVPAHRAHNGEINTVTGNENWMQRREALIQERRVRPAGRPGEDLPDLHPGARTPPLRRGARTAAPRRPQPAHAVLMMIPEAWERQESMDPPAGPSTPTTHR